MPATHFLCDGESHEITQVLYEAKDFGTFCGLPYPSLCLVADAVSKTHSKISVTGVLGCLRKAFYIHTMDYSINPIWTLQAAYGTALHAAVENSDLNIWEKEVNVTLTRDGVTITGIIDAIRTLNKHSVHLIDFKFPGQQKRSLLSPNQNTNEIQGYKDQIKSYVALWEQNFHCRVDRATIMFMPTSSKDINMIRNFDVPLTDKSVSMALNKLMARAGVLKTAFDTNTAPAYIKEDCMAIFCPPECKAECEQTRMEIELQDE